ncbi:acetoacetate decarboxylase family protein [Trujillonella endophytica]|uniref:Acetoacetate decarboxylase n=1 Tax=Trujillonella endophytica TaxID=673521 RepID=A0A1H8QSN3_9ACTN|nr:acetoacetate decarboxylase family protein [Trujillella endophytica]SEO57212.1 acetoacetate decarboxylase [Trujillella endophytica]
MSFRQSAESIARINATLANKRLSGERIEVAFRSDPDVIASVLPAPLVPSGNDRVTVRVTRWVTNYCGAFTMAGLYVDAAHDGLDGEYILSMFIDTYDAALLIGREGFGEPKKMASIDLFRSGNGFVGTVDRMGTRLMSLNVATGEDEGPSEGSGALYSIKATLALGGGLVDDALLMGQEVHVKSSENRRGPGSVKLGGTPHDPLDEFPVLEVLGASYAVSDMGETRPLRGKHVQAVIPAEEFLPFHYGRLDDWSAHDLLGPLESGKA